MKKSWLVGLVMGVLVSGGARADAGWHVSRTIPVTGDGGWDYMTLDPATHRLYITRFTHVEVIDVSNGAMVGDIPDTQGVHGVALDQATGRGFTSNGNANTVSMFDMKTLNVEATIPVGKKPDSIIDDPFDHRIFVMNSEGSSASAIDPATGKVVGEVALGGDPEFTAADGHGHVFVNLEDKSQVVEFDARTLNVLGHWPVAPGEGPSGMAIDRKHGRLFIGCHNQKMVVFDTKHHRVAGTVPIGAGVDANAYDAGLGLAFSSNGADGTLTVADGRTLQVLADVKTEDGARTMALDEVNHKVYLCTATIVRHPSHQERMRGMRPDYAPGSFHVLEVSR